MTKLANKYWLFIVTGLVLGLGFQIFLVFDHFRLIYGLGGAAPLACQIGDKFNCEAVTMSKFSELFGVPMALWGALVNAFVLAFFVTYLLSESKRLLGFWGAWIGCQVLFVTALVMAGISHFLIGAYCLYCMLTYLASIITWIGSLLWLKKERLLSLNNLLNTDVLKGLSLGLIVFLGLGFFLKWSADRSYGAETLKIILAESVIEWSQARESNFSNEGVLVKQRNPNVPRKMVVVEFVDLLCPACKLSSPEVFGFLNSKPDVELIVKLFPLDGNCNPSVEMTKGNGLRCLWSHAVLCAQKEGKGESALKWVFDNQEVISKAPFDSQKNSFVRHLNLISEALESCLISEETRQSVLKTAQEGLDARIRGTPAIFVNGRIVPRGQNRRVLEEVYRSIP